MNVSWILAAGLSLGSAFHSAHIPMRPDQKNELVGRMDRGKTSEDKSKYEYKGGGRKLPGNSHYGINIPMHLPTTRNTSVRCSKMQRKGYRTVRTSQKSSLMKGLRQACQDYRRKERAQNMNASHSSRVPTMVTILIAYDIVRYCIPKQETLNTNLPKPQAEEAAL